MSVKSLFGFDKVQPVEEKASTEIKLTGDMARACLSTKEFKQYRAQYAVMEEKVIDEMVIDAANFCVSPDSMEKFGAKCLIKLTRVRDLRSLVSKIENDAKKGIEKAGS